jgi:RNA polymerase sigma-70 factor (ECF subfamily)
MVIEEIVNDVFVKFWNYQSQIVIHSSVKDYLFKSTRNACIDYLRASQKYHRQTAYIDEQQIVCTTLADLGENPLDYLITHETGQRIMQAIDELPERYRLTFRLCRIDELSYDETAEIMSISKNTVKSNLRDAMAILREKLKDLVALLLLFFNLYS